MFRAEPLDQVSQAEAEDQDRAKPEPARQYDIHLDTRLTCRHDAKYTSSHPKDIEQVSANCDVMSKLWLLAQMKQPGRSLCTDLSPLTFPRMLKELLNKKNFKLKKELLDDKNVVTDPWNHCLTYEYELRKEACKTARETVFVQRGVGVCVQLKQAQDAPLAAACQSCHTPANSERISLGHPIPRSAVVAEVFGRYPTVSSWRCLLIDKTKTWQFKHLLHGTREVKDMFKVGNVCFNFQEGLCAEGAQRKREHRCSGCSGSKPYNECHCLQQIIQNLPLRSIPTAF